MREGREPGKQTSGGMLFQGKDIARVNAMRQKCARHVRMPTLLEQSGQERVIKKEVKSKSGEKADDTGSYSPCNGIG